ncbi:MAG: hypothetical protein N2Z74_01130, partial [Syntrophales bacterium]|nr:hypothetical protein [Syntrophales bacterium]
IYTLIWLASIPIGASCLAAFFLFPVLSTLQEMVRANGVDFKFASHFSFPPENLITLIAPFFHGDMINLPYWGRCYLWEMNLFFGISTLFFALWGATIKGRGRILTIMVVLSILLALGAHTPIFRILFDYLPGFSNFRGSSKFMFFTTLFLSLLASIGLDRLFQLKNFPRVMKLLFICGALSCSVVAGFLLDINSESLLNKWSGELWQKYLRFIAETSESYLPSHLFFREEFAVITANFAAIKLLWASVIFFLGALSVSLSVHRKSAIYLFVCLVVLEPLVFAKQMRPTFHYQDTLISVFARFHAAHQGDYRIFSSVAPNNALSVGSYDIWGYGPFALKRYCEFMASTQEKDPLKITSTYIDIRKFPSIMSMLRLRYIFTIQNGLISIAENSDYLSLGQIIHDWKIIETKEERLKEMLQQDFSPRALVILEKPPSFGHSSKTGNKNIAEYCTLQRISSDEIEVRAVLSRPGICLITENFSRGWRITPLPGEGTLLNYEIHPANHTLMAVPLSAGYHAFRLEYQPRCFVVGSLVSMMSLCFLVMIILYLVKSINGKHRFSRTV